MMRYYELDKIQTFLIFSIFTLFIVFFPILACMLFAVSVPALRLTRGLKNNFFIFLLSSFFTLINLLKEPESDAIVYIEALRSVSSLSLLQVLDFSYVSIRSSEFVFSLYLWLIGLLDTTGFLFNLFSVFIIYTLVFLSLREYFGKDSGLYIAFLGVVLFSITFSLTGHLVRQYIAAAVFLYALSFYTSSRKASFGLMILSGFIHNSLLPFAFTFYFVNPFFTKKSWVSFSFIAFCLSFFLSQFVGYFRSYSEIAFVKEDGSIPLVLIAIDLILLLGFYFIRIKSSVIYNSSKVFFTFLVLLISVLIISHDVSLVFLRFYFLVDFARCFILFYLIIYCRDVYSYGLYMKASFLFSIFCLMVFTFRFGQSAWDYGVNSLELFFSTSLFDIYDRIFNNIWSVMF